MVSGPDALDAAIRTGPKPRRGRRMLVAFSVVALLATISLVIETLHRQQVRLQTRQEVFLERVKREGGSYLIEQETHWLGMLLKWIDNQTGWKLPGDRVTRYVSDVYLMGPNFTDRDMPLVGTFRRLEKLHLYATGISDKGIHHVSGLKRLTELVVDPQISDEGLRHLSDLEHLTTLDLINTQVRGTGFAQVSGLKRLRNLYLTGTPFTDRGLAALASFPALETLNLDGTQITDAGLVHLAALQNLESLSLNRTEVTDAGLEHLKKLPRLRHVQLEGTRTSDAAALFLKQGLANRQRPSMSRQGGVIASEVK